MLNPITSHSRRQRLAISAIVATTLALGLGTIRLSNAEQAPAKAPTSHTSAAPTVTPPPAPIPAPPPIPAVPLIHPSTEMWVATVDASGYIMPWQESRIGSEIGGLRLSAVLVSNGDVVKKGQTLARLDAAAVEADLESANAQQAEAEGTLAQAVATLDRAKRLASSGGVSQQELTLYETQQHTAEARLNAARAQVKRQQLKLANTTLIAPDDGIISSVTASEGMIVQAGNELFRLIRQGRLEWRAEVPGETLLKLSPGQEVIVKSPLGTEVKGRVRRLSPTIDLATHKGLVYVDLPPGAALKAGLNVSGSIIMGKQHTLVLPASAIRHEQDEAQVLTLNAESRIRPVAITTGRVKGNRVEILSGLDDQALVIAKGLSDLKIDQLVKPESAQPDTSHR